MAHRLSPVGLDFTESAPLRLVFAQRMSAAPEAVFHTLAEEVEDVPLWFTPVRSVRSLAGGTGRAVRLRGGARFDELVIAATAPEVYAYRTVATNVPGLRALLEEWRLTPSEGGTHLRWTVAADGGPAVRLALRLGRAGLGRAFRDAVTRLDERLAA
ncbi:SRPBCC family protein [Streptomyces sp. NPDC058045]|uniref:SRPBCC family protein n=1 Tax=Streptomyces sp. NPDC058045 TaxID=3346311 RepID=UPI0036E8B79A